MAVDHLINVNRVSGRWSIVDIDLGGSTGMMMMMMTWSAKCKVKEFPALGRVGSTGCLAGLVYYAKGEGGRDP